MAGHSKWANIQHKKKKVDAKRGKVFTKLIRAITVAARMGGADVDANSRLRDTIAKAKAANMPNDTIDRAIKKGVGELEAGAMEEIIYEGYGPSGVAIMVFCLTDNKNRTVADVRHAFSKCGGNLGTAGSVAYLFNKQGQISFTSGNDEEKIMEVALEAGAEDIVNNDDGSIDVMTTPENFALVREAMQKAGLQADYADIEMIPTTTVELGKDDTEKMQRLQDMLEDLDDVQDVFSNADISDEVLQQLSS